MPEEVNSKSIFSSKTFWVNVLAVVAMSIQGLTGKNLFPLEYQATALSFINIILRTVTKSAVKWK